MMTRDEQGFVVNAVLLAQAVMDWNDRGVSMKALGTDDVVTLSESVRSEGMAMLYPAGDDDDYVVGGWQPMCPNVSWELLGLFAASVVIMGLALLGLVCLVESFI